MKKMADIMSLPAAGDVTCRLSGNNKGTVRLEVANGAGVASLRTLCEDDVTEAYVAGLNDAKVNRFLVGVRAQLQSLETVRSYVAANWHSDTDLLLGIFMDGGLRGTVRVHEISQDQGHAYLGAVLFDKAYWRRGIGHACLAMVKQFCFENLDLKLLTAGIYKSNTASQKAFGYAGFSYVPERDRDDPYDTIQFWEAPDMRTSPDLKG